MTNNAADRCETDYICKYMSPIGLITLASNGTAVTGAWFEGQKYYASTLKGAYEEKEVPVLRRAKLWLDAYFAGVQPREEVPLAFEGCSPFRKKVYEILLGIPLGSTTTYGEIARRIEAESGAKTSARAVGGAVGHNPVSIIVPCHRVLGKDGSLTGYAGGIERKIALLRLEGVDADRRGITKNKAAGI